jgi:hypothetical protein
MPMTIRLALAAAALIGAAAGASAQTLIGLTADNALVRIDAETRRASAPVAISGADGRVLGIDQRPQDGRLYGITDRGQFVTIDPATGRAMQVSRLAIPFEHGGRVVFDFNPVANWLRLMGVSGVNLRVNVDTGEAVADGTLRYAAGTPLAETTPRITAGAYINSAAGQTATALFTFDPLVGSYNLQAPPNDGVQQPRGMAGVSLPPGIAFDILFDGQANRGFLLAAATLYTVSLDTGALAALGPVAGLPAAEILDIAAMR